MRFFPVMCVLCSTLISGAALAGGGASPEELAAMAALRKSGFRVTPFNKTSASSAQLVFSDAFKSTNASLMPLRDLKKLEGLHLRYGDHNDQVLEAIKDLRNLKHLHLEYNGKIKDDGLVHLAKLDKLERLFLLRVGVTDAGLKHLGTLKSLTWINLEGAKITSEGLASLKPLKLRVLNLSGATIDDEALKTVGQFTELETLQLAYTKVTDQGLEHFAGLTKLKHIDLANTKINGTGLKHLKDCKFTSMFLNDAALTDAGLQSFAEFKEMRMLEEVRISNNKAITDKGIAVFGDLRVRYLFVGGTAVTEEGKARVKEKAPSIMFPKF